MKEASVVVAAMAMTSGDHKVLAFSLGYVVVVLAASALMARRRK